YEASTLYAQIEKMYPQAFHCVEKIKVYIKNTYDINISENEEIYLSLHIQKLTEQGEREKNNGL
ncbi:transcription antiterminator LicT, partial [Escherichia coli]